MSDPDWDGRMRAQAHGPQPPKFMTRSALELRVIALERLLRDWVRQRNHRGPYGPAHFTGLVERTERLLTRNWE
jgi:hypothetical protein